MIMMIMNLSLMMNNLFSITLKIVLNYLHFLSPVNWWFYYFCFDFSISCFDVMMMILFMMINSLLSL